jgi:hypothetical protein
MTAARRRAWVRFTRDWPLWAVPVLAAALLTIGGARLL